MTATLTAPARVERFDGVGPTSARRVLNMRELPNSESAHLRLLHLLQGIELRAVRYFGESHALVVLLRKCIANPSDHDAHCSMRVMLESLPIDDQLRLRGDWPPAVSRPTKAELLESYQQSTEPQRVLALDLCPDSEPALGDEIELTVSLENVLRRPGHVPVRIEIREGALLREVLELLTTATAWIEDNWMDALQGVEVEDDAPAPTSR
jgi:hypothetical protein